MRSDCGDGERGGKTERNREGRGGRRKKGRGRGREKPSLPNPPLFSLTPYPLPLSTPATQARGGVESGIPPYFSTLF